MKDAPTQQLVRRLLGEASNSAINVPKRWLKLSRLERLTCLVVCDLRSGTVIPAARFVTNLLRTRRAASRCKQRGSGK
jgi:hypothetical protein